MSEQNKPDGKSSQAVPAIAVVALLVSLFAAKDILLQPSRPAMMNTETAPTEDVRLRLWQDPFQAVEIYRKQSYSRSKDIKEIELPPITAENPVSGETFRIRSTKM